MPIPYGLLGAASGILQNSGPNPRPIGLGQQLGAGISGFLQGNALDRQEQRRAQLGGSLNQLADALNPKVVKPQYMKGISQVAVRSPVPSSYYPKLASAESSNRNIPQQINDTGTATGPFQFTQPTWDDLISRHPDLGLTSDDITNPTAQGRAIVYHTADNFNALKNALGRDPTEADLGLAHRFGAQGALSILSSPPSTPIGNILPAAIRANPQWGSMRAGDITRQTAKDLGVESPQHGQSILNVSSPSSATLNPGLAALLGGGDLAPQPFGAGLQNMTPQLREMLSIALRDPSLGPYAMQTLFQIGASQPGGRGARSQLPDKALNAILAGVSPGTPEWKQAILGAEKPEETTGPQKDAKALGLVPGTPAYDAYIRQRTLPQAAAAPSVTVNVPGQPRPETERAADKAFGEALGTLAGDLIKAAPQRRQDLAAVDASERLLANLESAGREPGKWADLKNEITRGYYTVTGQEVPKDVQDFRTFSAQLNKDVLGMIGKGGIPANNFSDADRQFIQMIATSPQDDPATLRAKFAIRRGTLQAEDFLTKKIMDLRKQGLPTEDAVGKSMDALQGRDFIAEQPAVKQWAQTQQQQTAPSGQTSPLPMPSAASISGMSLQQLQNAVESNPDMLKDPALSSVIRQKIGM